MGPAARMALPALARTLADDGTPTAVQQVLVDALEHIGPDQRETVAVLDRAAKEADRWARRAAAEALARLKSRRD